MDGVVAFSPNRRGIPHRAISRIGKFGGDRERRGTQRLAGAWKQHGPDPATLRGARTTEPAQRLRCGTLPPCFLSLARVVFGECRGRSDAVFGP